MAFKTVKFGILICELSYISTSQFDNQQNLLNDDRAYVGHEKYNYQLLTLSAQICRNNALTRESV